MRVENLEKCIAEKVISINSMQEFEKFLEFCGKGNLYFLSVENLMAVYAQNPSATIVSGFDGWKKLGRYPVNSNSGIAVYPFNTSSAFGKSMFAS